MKNSSLIWAANLVVGGALIAGCTSTEGRQVSLSNEDVPQLAKSGKGVISAVGNSGDATDQSVRPIEAARPEPKPSSWSKLLLPFKAKRKRIPLPLSKPDESQPDLEVGIDEF